MADPKQPGDTGLTAAEIAQREFAGQIHENEADLNQPSPRGDAQEELHAEQEAIPADPPYRQDPTQDAKTYNSTPEDENNLTAAEINHDIEPDQDPGPKEIGIQELQTNHKMHENTGLVSGTSGGSTTKAKTRAEVAEEELNLRSRARMMTAITQTMDAIDKTISHTLDRMNDLEEQSISALYKVDQAIDGLDLMLMGTDGPDGDIGLLGRIEQDDIIMADRIGQDDLNSSKLFLMAHESKVEKTAYVEASADIKTTLEELTKDSQEAMLDLRSRQTAIGDSLATLKASKDADPAEIAKLEDQLKTIGDDIKAQTEQAKLIAEAADIAKDVSTNENTSTGEKTRSLNVISSAIKSSQDGTINKGEWAGIKEKVAGLDPNDPHSQRSLALMAKSGVAIEDAEGNILKGDAAVAYIKSELQDAKDVKTYAATNPEVKLEDGQVLQGKEAAEHLLATNPDDFKAAVAVTEQANTEQIDADIEAVKNTDIPETNLAPEGLLSSSEDPGLKAYAGDNPFGSAPVDGPVGATIPTSNPILVGPSNLGSFADSVEFKASDGPEPLVGDETPINNGAPEQGTAVTAAQQSLAFETGTGGGTGDEGGTGGGTETHDQEPTPQDIGEPVVIAPQEPAQDPLSPTV